MITKEELDPLLITAGILAAIASVGAMFTQTSFTNVFSLAFAIFTYIILPGYFIMLNFKLTNLERIIFSMPTSITIVSISLYSVDLIGIPLSTITTISIITLISIISIIPRRNS